MNKEDILKRVEKKRNDEMVEYLDNKATRYSLIIFSILCLIIIFISFSSQYQKELFHTPLCLISMFSFVYLASSYYYFKKKFYLMISCVSFVVFAYEITQVWLFIW